MGIRGELYTNQVNLDNRSYFFNVKENRKSKKEQTTEDPLLSLPMTCRNFFQEWTVL